jgi:hypothetical protein
VRFTVRLLGAIWIAALIVIGGFAFFQVRAERQRLTHDLEGRAALLGEGLKESIESVVSKGSTQRLKRLLKKFAGSDRGIAVYDGLASLIVAAPEMPVSLPPSVPEVTEAITRGRVEQGLRAIDGRRMYIYATPLEDEERTIGALAVFLDASRLGDAEAAIWRYNAVRFFPWPWAFR